MKTKILSFCFFSLLAALPLACQARGAIEQLSSDPYLGAIVIDAGTGQVLFEDHSDVKGYPASVLKLMDLLIILEKIKAGAIRAEDQVTVTAEVSKIGGSQVYLKEHEVFPLDELLYALMVQSANDAAAALAARVAGSKEGFVALMNQRALEIGMKATEFHSIHGLPPGKDQSPDITTARDLARLARELLKHPEALLYTSCRERGFRNNSFIMRNHNPLLVSFPGCDGFKTGYFTKAGYSIIATASRGSDRVIAVVLGSKSKKARNSKAAELMEKGFALLAQRRALTPAQTNIVAPPPEPEPIEEEPRCGRSVWLVVSLILLAALAGAAYRIFFYRPEKNEFVERQ